MQTKIRRVFVVERTQNVEYEKSYEQKTSPSINFDTSCNREVKVLEINHLALENDYKQSVL